MVRTKDHRSLPLRLGAAMRTMLLGFAGVWAAMAQTADAVAVKIPAASMPSTVVISAGTASGRVGKTVVVPVSVAVQGSVAPTTFQVDVTYDPTKLTYVSASAGGQLTNAGLGLMATAMSSSDVRLMSTGTTEASFGSGVVANLSFTLAANFPAAGAAIAPLNCIATSAGTPLATACAAGSVTAGTCNVSGDASAGVTDVQTMIDEALGVAPATNDLNGDGVVNVADVRIVLSAALGGACVL